MFIPSVQTVWCQGFAVVGLLFFEHCYFGLYLYFGLYIGGNETITN